MSAPKGVRRFVIVAMILALGWFGFNRLKTWQARGELRLAQRDIAVGRLDAARARLVSLSAGESLMKGTAHYWLGMCESLAGRPEEALRAFSQVPEGFPFDVNGSYHEAKANLSLGRLLPAERRLEAAMSSGGSGLERVRNLLSEVYQIEARFDDVKPLLRARLDGEADPVGTLKELDNFDLDRLPYDALRLTLDEAGRKAPGDGRVWLGKARLANYAGHWDAAADLLKRCPANDSAVCKAWLDWARGTGQTAEAERWAKCLGTAGLTLVERLELRAWLFRERGDEVAEAEVLRRWIAMEPAASQALDRLATIEQRAGHHGQAKELRLRKAEAARALEGYRGRLWREEPLLTSKARFELAILAERAGRSREAAALNAWALRADPTNRSAQEALSRLGKSASFAVEGGDPWAEISPSPAPAARAAVPAEKDAILAFSDDAEEAGLRFIYDNAGTPLRQLPEPFGGGVALFDYDGDGRLDVYCVQGGPFRDKPTEKPESSGDRLFRNRGDGTFEDATEQSGVASFRRGHGHGVTAGDIDGDGHTDLLVTRWRSYALYRNRGDGTFEDVTAAWGLGGRRDWPSSAVFADLDGDGDLDLYVAHYAVWDLENPRICREAKTGIYLNCNPLEVEALPDHLFRNDGGRFIDVTAEAGINDSDGRGLGVVAADFDGDHRVDLFVANDSSANFLYRNLGGMRFEEVGLAAGVACNASGKYLAGMGVAAGDLDGDERIDLLVTNFYGESTTFYQNLGEGFFADATDAIGLRVATRRLLGFGVSLLDANDDGLLDLVSANGHVNDLRPNYPYLMPAQLLIGNQAGRLIDVSSRAGLPWPVPRMGRGLAVGDLDNDGRQDILILSHNQPLAFFHNKSGGGHSLTLKLQGRGANTGAVGASVAVAAGGKKRRAWRVGGGSYQSASDPRIHLGLGTAGRAEVVEVTWPSGRTGRYTNLEAGGYLLREGETQAAPLPGWRGTGSESGSESESGRK